MSWQLQEAKQRFSELVRLVLQLDLPRLAGYRAHGGLLGSGPVSPSELLQIAGMSGIGLLLGGLAARGLVLLAALPAGAVIEPSLSGASSSAACWAAMAAPPPPSAGVAAAAAPMTSFFLFTLPPFVLPCVPMLPPVVKKPMRGR